MAKIFPGRFTAQVSTQIEDPFIVLILGIRINNFLLFWKWIPTIFSSFPMVFTLVRHKAAGFLGGQATFFWPGIGIIQYWRTFDELEQFARSQRYPHLKSWRWYNKAIGARGSVGLWHEVYFVEPDCHETVYDNMPIFGLATSAKHAPVGGHSKVTRLHLGEEAVPAVSLPADSVACD